MNRAHWTAHSLRGRAAARNASTSSDVNGRIASLLLELAREEGGTTITRRLTHATIGQMVGASRETVSRTMRSLVVRGVIVQSRREIQLRDLAQLRLAAQRMAEPVASPPE